MADGKIIIDTKIDGSGAEKGIKALGSKLGGMAKKSMKVVTTSIKAGAVALGAFGAYAIKTGADFEEQMSRVKAISGATGGEFEQLKQQALDLGASTAFSAKEAAEGMENLASAGFTTKEIMQAMPGMLDLAASSGEDLAASSEIAAGTLRGFGLEAAQAGHVADVLAKNAADTNAAIVDTGEAMKYIAPVARNAGWSLETVTAAIGIMADANIKGSQAGTTLRGALTRLMNPPKQAAEALQDLGMSVYDTKGKMKDLPTILNELTDKTKKLSDEDKNAAIARIFGTNALSGMTALMQKGGDELNNLTTALKNSDGAAAEMSTTMKDNLKGAVEELGGAVETLGINFYYSVNNPLKEIVLTATDMVKQLSNAFETGGISGLAGELGNIFSQILISLSESLPRITELAGKVISNFIEGIRKNLPLMAVSGMELLNSLADSIVQLLPQMIDLGMKMIFHFGEGILLSLPELFEKLATLIDNIVQTLMENLPKIIELGAKLILALAQGFAENFPQMVPKILELVQKIAESITNNISTIIDAGIEIIMALVNGLIQALPFLIQELPRIINEFANAIYSNLPKIIEAGIQIIIMLGKGLIQAIPMLLANLPQIIMAIFNAITLFNWASAGKSLVSAIGSGIKSMIGNIGNIAKGLAGGVRDIIRSIFSSGNGLGKGFVQRLISGIRGMFSFLRSAASGLAKDAVGAIKGGFSKVGEIGTNMVKGLWNGIKNVKDWILGKIKGFCSGITDGIKSFFGIHSPSRLMRDMIGKNLVRGIGIGFDIETPNLQKDIDSNLSSLTAKMQATVDYETSKTSRAMTSGNKTINNSNTVTNNDNGVTQNIHINQPVKSPAETARALKKVGRDLVLGC